MKKLRIIFLGLALFMSGYASAQDFYFSQFNSSPLHLNPALTGSINGKARVVANYRSQWSNILQDDAYKTYALSYDRRKNLKSGDYIGMGISGSRDISGSARFSTTQVALSFSFAKTISKSASASHSLIGGLQSGIARRMIDPTNLRWSSQNNGQGGFDPNSPAGFINQQDIIFIDVNGGLNWVSSFGERKNIYAGISVFHINRPNTSFQNDDVPLSIKTSVQAGGELPLSSRLSLLPSMLYLNQGVQGQLSIGAMVSLSNMTNSFVSNIQGGVFYRAGKGSEGLLHSDAIITVLSLQLKGVQLGFSYDYTISNLNFDTLGTLEFSVGYIFGKTNKKATPFEVPQF